MRVITHKRIKEFIEEHPNASAPLNEWYHKTLDAKWNNLNDIKQSFNSVDYVGNKRYVFNIGGNNFRLVAMILLKAQQVYIRFIGTHKEYDNLDCKNI